MKCLNPDLINERRFWRFFNDEAEKYNLVFRPYSVKENKNEGYSLQIYDLLNADGKGKKLYENSFFFDKEIEKGGGRGLFGLYCSAYKDVSFIDSVITSISNLDKNVIKDMRRYAMFIGDTVIHKLTNHLVHLFIIHLYDLM